MNIEKLPSGSYRITQKVNGKRYRATVDHRPSSAEAVEIIAELMKEQSSGPDMTFSRACELYIGSKSNILSVSTVRGYRGLMRQIDGVFLARQIQTITLPMIQDEINRFSADHSAKSVYNLSGFIMSVLKYYGIEIKGVKLPQREKKSVYIPTEEEVKKIFEKLKNDRFEVPIMLAAMGLRRSEICALTLEDLNGSTLTINKALVQGSDEQWHIKKTKTTDSTRTIILPEYLADRIRQQGFIYDGHPELISRRLTEVETELGIQRFTLHKLRHFFASYMHQNGFTDKQIQDMGGWKTDGIMKTVYQHAMEIDQAKEMAAEKMGCLF